MIYSILRVPKNLKADAADALAVAICLAHSYSWENSLRLLAAGKPLVVGPRSKVQNDAGLEGQE
jgi:hypothetical protein